MKRHVRSWLGNLRLRTEEAYHLAQMGSSLFLLGIAYSVGTVLAEAALLGTAGAQWLPTAFVLQQLITFLIGGIYIRWGRDARPHRPFLGLGWIAFFSSIVCSVATYNGALLAPVVLFAIVHGTASLTLIHYHNVRGTLMDAQTTKRILPRIIACFLMGKMTGGLLSLCGEWLPPSFCALMFGILFKLATLIMARPYRAVKPAPPPPANNPIRAGWDALFAHPFCRWILLTTFLIVTSERLLELTSGKLLAVHHSVKDLTHILGLFTAASSLVAAFIQVVVVSPIVSRLGPARATFLFPLMSMSAIVFTFLVPTNLMGALVCRFAYAFLPAATVDPTWGLLEGGMPVKMARNMRVLKNALLRPVATLLVASGAITWFLPSPLHGAAAGVAAIGVLIVLAPGLYARTWLDMIKDRGSSRGDLRHIQVPRDGDPIWAEVTTAMTGDDPDAGDAALELVESAGTPGAMRAAIGALEASQHGLGRARVLEVLGRMGWQPPPPWIQRLGQDVPAVRSELYLIPPSDADLLAGLASKESASFARISAAAFLLTREPGREDLRKLIEDALRSSSPSRVCLGLRAASRSGDESFLPLVLELGAHSADRVRRTALQPLRRFGQREALENVVRGDQNGGIRASALVEVSRLDRHRAQKLSPGLLGDPSGQVRRTAAQLVEECGAAALRAVRDLARDSRRSWRLREECLLLTARIVPSTRVHQVVSRQEIRRALRLDKLIRKIPPESPHRGVWVARELLEDEVALSFYVATRALCVFLAEDIFDTTLEKLRSNQANVRSQALEVLSSHLPQGVPPAMLHLVKDVDDLARLYIGSSMMGFPLARSGQRVAPTTASPQELVDAFHDLLPEASPYVRSSLLWAIHDLTGQVPEVIPLHPLETDTLSWLASPVYPDGMALLARIAFLKGTEFFSGFTAEELHMLAQVAQVNRYTTGQALFRQGEKADELFIVLKGTVDVVLEHPGPELSIQQLGPKEIVGELGLFDGHPRSASVIALGPVEALSLSRTDLMEVLAQSPTVAMAFLKTLAVRLRRSTAQVAGGALGVCPLPTATTK